MAKGIQEGTKHTLKDQMSGECRARNKEESIRNVAKKMSGAILCGALCYAKELEFIEFFLIVCVF